MRSIYHKDIVGKLLNKGDYVIWASSRQGYGMRLAKVDDFTPRQVWIIILETGERKRCFHHHLFCVTDQLAANELSGTGVELDIPAEGRDLLSKGMTPGQSARSWFEANGIDVDEYIKGGVND